MKKLLFLLSLLVTSKVFATIRVAVVDTGVRQNGDYLCPTGHVDLTGRGYYDYNGHGTNISGIIHKNNIDRDYCQVILKYTTGIGYEKALENTIEAFRLAIEEKVDIINYSSVGDQPNPEEKKMVLKVLDAGIILVVASGNQGYNLDMGCSAYPACYDERIIVVGRDPKYYGNFGSIVDYYINGTNQTGFGVTMSGTSQSTAVMTGKLITEKARKRR